MCDEACAAVAVCYTGWLNVTIPERGASAKAHLIDVLNADVLLAAYDALVGKGMRPRTEGYR